MLDASVIIPTHNRDVILKLVLSALAKQSYPCDRFEVLVVDDGSTDHTEEIVGEFKDTLNLHYLRFDKSTHRLSRVRNCGIERSQGEILFFLDSDMIVCSHYVEEHLRTHRESDDLMLIIGYVYGYRYGYSSEGTLPIDHLDLENVSKSIEQLRADRTLWDPREIAYRRVADDLSRFSAPWRFVWGNSISVPRKHVLEVGMFDEDFHYTGGEDTEFAYRCFKNGLHVVLNRRAWGVHYPHPIDVEARKQSSQRNILWFYQKHRNPEIELYSVTQRHTYNRFLAQLRALQGQVLVPSYSSPRYRQTWDFLGSLSPGRTLLVGGGGVDLIRKVWPSVVTELDQDRVERERNTFPDVDFKWAIGLRLSYTDGYFDRVILSDFWRALSRICVAKLLREMVRVGKDILTLCVPEFKPSLPEGCPWHSPAVLQRTCRRVGLSCAPVPGVPSVYRISVHSSLSEG